MGYLNLSILSPFVTQSIKFLVLDPEELLNSLLSQTLKASPFLEISSGQSAYLYQLFVERDMSRTTHPTVQELFEKSFLTSEIKLKKVPPVLILQMPRYGRQFKVFDRILPSQLLDVTDVIEDCKSSIILYNLNSIFYHFYPCRIAFISFANFF